MAFSESADVSTLQETVCTIKSSTAFMIVFEMFFLGGHVDTAQKQVKIPTETSIPQGLCLLRLFAKDLSAVTQA